MHTLFVPEPWYDKSALTFHKTAHKRTRQVESVVCITPRVKKGSQTLKSRIRRRRAEVDMVFDLFLILLDFCLEAGGGGGGYFFFFEFSPP